ncbi:transferase [Gigaspora rosea]|uniref:Transferase n=1 Tax=Gigaspora rosea TaxID=44941 RepID=A0A397VKK2_9GLOM|nr:transferase [Gigaspora rosea]
MNIQKLLASLEDVLNDYYPLAGTLKNSSNGRTIIDCNDRGVQFIIAECSDITINQLEEKKWEHAVTPHGLMPTAIISNKIDPILFIIQYTTFADGSVALSFAIHHQIMDGFGLFTFIENWGRRAPRDNPPTYVPYEYFVRQLTESNFSNARMSPVTTPITTKIFSFSHDDLKRLRDYYSVGIPNGSWISTNDALVAHIWRTVIRARNTDLNTEVFCRFALDGRNRLNPPIPKSYYGNVIL